MEKTEANEYLQAMLKDGIVTVYYKPGIWLGLEDAQRIVASRLHFFGNLKFPVLVKTDQIQGIDLSACRYFFTEGMVNFTAIAIVELNSVEKLLAQLLFNLYPQEIPFQVFSNEQDARNWLMQFI